MENNDIYDLIIIGGGPGGMGAGIYAIRAALKTLLIEKGVMGGQISVTDEVENYLGIEKTSGAELCMKFSEHVAAYGLEIVHREVAALEPGLDHHRVTLDDGKVFFAHAVILATGGNPKQLGIPGESDNYGKGVSYCGVCDGFFFRNKTVAVVGGGDTAAEEALYLSKITKRVFMIHRRDQLRAGAILQKRVLSECKIEMIWDTIPTRINDAEGSVVSMDLQNVKSGKTRSLSVDGVFIFIGFNPNNLLVPAGTKMNREGYVAANEKCETNTPGIYVVGDLREKYARQIIISAADGCTAALAAAHYVEIKKSQGDDCPPPADLLNETD